MQPTVYKVVMIGSGGVGKSALTLQFMYDEFIEDYEPTKGDSYRKKWVYRDSEIYIDIFDTAGQDDFLSISQNLYRAGNGFLLIYSVTTPESLDDLENFREQVLRIKDAESVPMVVVANKIDLLDDPNDPVLDRGRAFARAYGIPFIQSSAKNQKNVLEAFQTIIKLVTENQPSQPHFAPKKKKKHCILL